MALRGFDNLNAVLRVMRVRAATAVLNWNARKFWILWNMDFPARSEEITFG
jgi:hypothetical protein